MTGTGSYFALAGAGSSIYSVISRWIGWLIKSKTNSIQPRVMEHPKLQDKFYMDYLELISKAREIHILNFSTNTICRGADYKGIKFNKDNEVPFRGAYFEFEELMLRKSEKAIERFRNYVEDGQIFKNRRQRKFLNKYISLAKSDDPFTIKRVVSIVSENAYKKVKEKANISERVDHWDEVKRRLQARHISIIEHLCRLEESEGYYIYGLPYPIYEPQPTLLYYQSRQPGKDRALWGFLLPSGETPTKYQPDIALILKGERMVEAIKRTVDGAIKADARIEVSCLMDPTKIYWANLLELNPLIISDICRDSDFEEREIPENIKSMLTEEVGKRCPNG
jgi:hypothetical protein